eukprot:c46298_g1_i1 orf=63-383(+)
MDLTGLDGGLVVTTRILVLLLEYAPYVDEIGTCIHYVVGDVVVRQDVDCTISLRMILYPFLVLPSLVYSLPTSHGGEILERVFFIGLPNHCFFNGKKGHAIAHGAG